MLNLKKRFTSTSSKLVILMSFLLISATLFTACSKDDDEPKTTTTNLVGTKWKTIPDEDGDYTLLHFQTATTGEYTWWVSIFEELFEDPFTYTFDGTTLNIITENTNSLKGSISGNKMTLTYYTEDWEGATRDFFKQ